MAARPRTPSYDGGLTSGAPLSGKATDSSPLSNAGGARPMSAAFSYAPGDDYETDGPTVQQLEGAGLHRAASSSSRGGRVSRSNTLTKGNTISRKSSLKRSGSKKSLSAGSIKGVQIDDPKRTPGDEYNSAFYCPVPTSGSPTEILANRFQAWRKFLKDLIAYFKEVQSSYEHRSKALLKVANVVNNTPAPPMFLSSGGLNEANRILREYHQQAVSEVNKARNIEEDVITQLAGLRADLSQKIKEIKSLSGDFKNSVDKEKDHTRKAVNGLSEALAVVDRDSTALVGKEDPYIIKLSVDRQIERQIDEENYLHRAYLNLEGSGRELESIVVGEVQKAYNALAGILKREADESYNTVDALRNGPVTISKELEWKHFVDNDPHFISADTPLRKVEDIEYPGKFHPAAAEVRAGMLERKSKYLKSYTPGWYVLSPTHLHEFKSADHIYSQSPIMSLLLTDQKLGSHSQPGSSSHKFMLKGSQTGSLHRGHSWVFRAETYDTMLAWFDDIRNLTEKTGEERNAFVRKHARSFSHGSQRASSISGDSALEEDEADEVPFSAAGSTRGVDSAFGAGSSSQEQEREMLNQKPKRPEPGGRFPSDLNVLTARGAGLRDPESNSTGSSEDAERDFQGASLVGVQPTAPAKEYQDETPTSGLRREPGQYGDFSTSAAVPATTGPETVRRERAEPGHFGSTASQQRELPPQTTTTTTTTQYPPTTTYTTPNVPGNQSVPQTLNLNPPQNLARHDSNYTNWMAPAAGAGVGAAGVLGTEQYWRKQRDDAAKREAIQEVDMADTANSPAADAGILPLPATSTKPLQASHIAPTSPVEPILSTPIIPSSASIISQDTTATELTDTPPASKTTFTGPSTTGVADYGQVTPGEHVVAEGHTMYDTNPDGSVNAAFTGRGFPIMRHNTDVSVSNLHVPGEYPEGRGV